jgi:hypothetical protein
MSQLLPPAPNGAPPGSAFWNIWYEKVRTLVNQTVSSTVAWTALNFSSSNITDIVNRAHNNLTSLQGGTAGEYYHLTAAQYATLTTTGILTLYSKSSDPTTSDITASTAKLYKNTTTSVVKLWVNDAGTLKSVTLS